MTHVEKHLGEPKEGLSLTAKRTTAQQRQKVHHEPDQSGRRRPIVIEGSNHEVEVDQVVMAIGNGSNALLTSTFPELQLNKWGNVVADEGMRTSYPGVFAGGDIVTGAATVIEAMGAGKIAAESIDAYVSGREPEWPEM